MAATEREIVGESSDKMVNVEEGVCILGKNYGIGCSAVVVEEADGSGGGSGGDIGSVAGFCGMADGSGTRAETGDDYDVTDGSAFESIWSMIFPVGGQGWPMR